MPTSASEYHPETLSTLMMALAMILGLVFGLALLSLCNTGCRA